MDNQVGDAKCGQEVSWMICSCGAEEPCLPVWRRQVEPHARIPRCVDGTGDGTAKLRYWWWKCVGSSGGAVQIIAITTTTTPWCIYCEMLTWYLRRVDAGRQQRPEPVGNYTLSPVRSQRVDSCNTHTHTHTTSASSFLRRLTTWHCSHLLLQSIDISWPPGPQQQTRRNVRAAAEWWDRRTDGRTPDSFI